MAECLIEGSLRTKLKESSPLYPWVNLLNDEPALGQGGGTTKVAEVIRGEHLFEALALGCTTWSRNSF